MALARFGRAASVLSQQLAQVAPAAVQSRSFSQSLPTHSLLDKTGKTGAAVLGAGLAAYAVSKEVLILNHETVVVVSVAGVTYLLVKKVGGDVADALDSYAKGIHDSLSAARNRTIADLESSIEELKEYKVQLGAYDKLFDIKREINALNREIQFRKAKKDARDSAEKQLRDILQIESSLRKQEQDALIASLERDVVASIRGTEASVLNKCVQDLYVLANRV